MGPLGRLTLCLLLATASSRSSAQNAEPVAPPWSPCSQSSDEDDDGHAESITYYVYDTAGALTDTVVDDGNDGRPEAWQHLTIGPDSRPVASVLRQPVHAPSARPERDCTTWCSEPWVALCPVSMLECGRDAMGRVVTMYGAGDGVLRNDYSCWVLANDAWAYRGPTIEELLAPVP